MKYYAYTRVSTESQVQDGYGLDTQKTEIDKYAERHGLTICDFYSDAGVSGTVYDRPGLMDLVSVLENGDKIIVWETSRLWREDMVRCTLTHTLKKIGCDIVSVSQPSYSLYSDNPSDWLLNSILGILDEYDRILTVRKLRSGRRTKAKSGSKACGTAPIGYRWEKANIEIDPPNAAIVTDIFNAYAEYQSLSKVAEFCETRNYRTLRGNSFSRQSLRAILSNSFYIGVVRYQTEYQGTHQAIVDKPLFDNVQSILKRRGA